MELKMSKNSTIDYNNFMREVCASTLLNQPRSIGGEGKTVEIDYTYFTKRKNEKGKLVPDQWVFGGICRETDEIFLCTIPDTTEDAVIECIKNNIQPETTIISDCQPAFKNIENIEGCDYKHLMINNSENVVDPNLNANIQSIENIWFILNERNKNHCGTYSKMLDSYLSEFVWRRRYANKDLFFNILKDISSFESSNVLPSPLDKKASSSGRDMGKKRKRNKSEESLKLEDNSCPSVDDQFMCIQGYVNEFDRFGRSVATKLNSMPRNRSAQLRLKIEELVTNFRQQMSLTTPNNSTMEVPPLYDENFIDIKKEIFDDSDE